LEESSEKFRTKETCSAGFAVAGMLESRIAFGSDKSKINAISRQQLSDCISKIKCEKGWKRFFATLKYAVNNGLHLEKNYAPKGFTGKKGKCHAGSTDGTKVDTKPFKKYVLHRKLSAAEMKFLLLRGPLGVTIDGSADEFKFYKNGILQYKCGKPTHSLLLVGYFDPRIKNNKKNLALITKGVQIDKPVWILRNSWGEGWGAKGHIFLEMKEDWSCGMYENVLEFIK